MPYTSERRKRLLSKVYASQFVTDVDPLDFLSSSLETGKKSLLVEINDLKQSKLVTMRKNIPSVTKLGRSKIIVIMAGGSFDIIHPGHLETLEQARALGDSLIVSVARDATFRRNKKKEPLHNEDLRQKLVAALKVVDAAVLGSEHDILETAVMIKPDIVALGYDQYHDGQSIQKDLMKRGLKVDVVRLKSSVPEIKTASIIGYDDGSLLDST
ncbi:MAG TPA: adenylyltransferase/cytidyltransferase family protein [Nitrososphaerales archaeon]|nr:adenylyltransferase/cytidyltransferase family protein [Nitrososphaerales archaeon]